MKKLGWLCLFLALWGVLSAFPAGAESSGCDPLWEHAGALVKKLDSQAESEAYAALFSASPEINERILAWGAGDYSQVKAAYRASLGKEQMLSALTAAGVPFDALPEELLTSVIWRLAAALPAQLNAAEGASVLAACSIANVQTAFLYEGLTEPVLYLLVYPEAVPVAVTFWPEEDGVVSARADFIAAQALSSIESSHDVDAVFSPLVGNICFEEIAVN